MTAFTQEKEIVGTIASAQMCSANADQTAIESKPLVGGQVTIKLALTPGMITMIAAPVTILISMMVGWVLLTSLSLPVHTHEMIGAGIVNMIGGMLAALPLFLMMKRGAAIIAQAAIAGIFIRVGVILVGMVLVGAGGWGLTRTILAYWVLGCYFPLLMVETATVAWLSHKAKH